MDCLFSSSMSLISFCQLRRHLVWRITRPASKFTRSWVGVMGKKIKKQNPVACPCVINFSHLFQGFFETGNRMLQRERLREAGTHHLWLGVATRLFVWVIDEKWEKRLKKKKTKGGWSLRRHPFGNPFFGYLRECLSNTKEKVMWRNWPT